MRGGKNRNFKGVSLARSSSRLRPRPLSKSSNATRPKNFLVSRSTTGNLVRLFSAIR